MVDWTEAYRQCLDEIDVAGMRRLFRVHQPHLPQPENDAECLASMHLARTAAKEMSLDKRAYSHAWCRERGLPSMLPDRLKPAAERLYPVVAAAVGIAVKSNSPHMRPAITQIRGAMENAVYEAIEDRKFDDAGHVRRRILEARRYIVGKLFG